MSDITYTKHGDKRVNNPSMEQRGFLVEEELKPYGTRYPRDPSLDPQLVWKGKDEQDAEDLIVSTVPIYRQEHVHPRVLIEELRSSQSAVRSEQSGSGLPTGNRQLQTTFDLFGDHNGLEAADELEKLQRSTEFYQHEKNWTNRMILGDSLLVMNSLAEKEGLKGKVQCIYIDPPYGIKFGSNWQVSTRKREVKDGKAEDAAREPEVIRAFRDTWKLGIHSYLSYLRDRFRVAQELLTETGSIFVQIGDENVHLVRCVLDEVFGAENFVSMISYAKTTGFASDNVENVADHILWYAKTITSCKSRRLYQDKKEGLGGGARYRAVGTIRGAQGLGHEHLRPGTSADLTSQGASLSDQSFTFAGRTWLPPSGMHWKTTVEGLGRLALAGRVFVEGNSIRYLRFIDDFAAHSYTNLWLDVGGIQSRIDPKIYVVQTATEAVKRCILMATDPGDLVLDPTCGSGTTAYVAEQWGRRWITIDTSRVSLALARTRLMCARFPYYLLSDSNEGATMEAQIDGTYEQWAKLPGTVYFGNIKRGFVYKRVPHVTLKSIANNPDIDAIAASYQPKLDEACRVMNSFRPDKAWNEWEVPSPDYDSVGRQEATPDMKPFWDSLDDFWRLKREMRLEIDQAIAKHADTEYLFDQPYEDKGKVRVTGPFTVESLSPHRILPVDEEGVPTGEEEAKRDDVANDFITMVIENLKKAGVQNTKKGERLKFDTLEPHAGRWVHATGSYTMAGPDPSPPSPLSPEGRGGGRTIRVAVSVGPEYGAVSPLQIKEAAKEAVQGIGFDVLVVCGYAFDPHVNEETKQIGQLTILPARMNADLLMGDDLLKKTGAGNLFMVFGEPDIDVLHVKVDGDEGAPFLGAGIQVELKGLDVYDPTTGEIRSNSTAEIACWFIDTDYNGESFFVRHAYFVGAEVTDKKDGQKYDPYRALRSTLRAEIDPEAWHSIYSTKSRPFRRPTTGKFAVKVINHYGDEVLKVYDLEKL